MCESTAGAYRAYGHGGARAPKTLGGARGHWEGIAIGVPDNAFTLYIYFTNGNWSVKADFCLNRQNN